MFDGLLLSVVVGFLGYVVNLLFFDRWWCFIG